MICEVFCVGTEVLIGDIANTNAMYLGKKLSENGIDVLYHSVCGDNSVRIEKCLENALGRSDLVITTGGLGPTYDDITKEIVAKYFELPLVLNESSLDRIKEYFEKCHKSMTANNEKQALIPKGAYVFENMFGTADGICVTAKGKTVIMLPGPPREMRPMLDNQVLPYLREMGMCKNVLVSSNVNIFGMGEASVENLFRDLMQNSKNPTVAPYVANGEVRLRVTASADNDENARAIIAPVVQQIKATLGNAVYGVDEPSIENVVVRMLREKGKTVSFAESCTGGMISSRLTSVSGASEVFGYGFCTYANEAKVKILGVNPKTLEEYGAVSEQTAREMALGALKVSGADIAVSVTGIAGPTGGSEEKPVGLVYMGVATEREVKVKKLLLARHKGADREFVRTLTATNAFKEILDILREM